MLYKLVLLLSSAAVLSQAAVPPPSIDLLAPLPPSLPTLGNELLPPLLPSEVATKPKPNVFVASTTKPVTTTTRRLTTTTRTTKRPVTTRPSTRSPVRKIAPVFTAQKPATSSVFASSAAQRFNVRRTDNIKKGSYNYDFKLANGIKAQSTGSLRTSKTDPTKMFGVVQGEYSYMDPKGNTIIVTYTADENGYKPKLRLIPAKRN